MAESPRPSAQLVTSLLLVLAAGSLAFVLLIELVRYTAPFFCSILAAVALVAVAVQILYQRGVLGDDVDVIGS